ncbi:MAG TPA: acetyl-CoA carboxylase biotin carboxylase subunit [Saprospiraceae bacterium]|nr:acetyl-CoA carboxylase biotin carboxylase subunit [Saprospiraceae bacterium]
MKKILIANRGEIAVRVMRTIHKMGLQSVAVYSDADRNAPHVLMADEAVCIGAPSPSESYLNMPKILDAARTTGADAIHPGYGFLSENAVFARAVTDAGLIWIGPPTAVIELMGSKLAAKSTALQHNIPLVPGTESPIDDVDVALKRAKEIGFPVLIKASAGGGGKGMRIVEEASVFREQMERAMSEARNAFGDSSVFIEKYVTSPRHIEVQIMADKHGNCIHLFERECSIQRRHQKVVEEAPSSFVTPELRKQIGEAAVRIAQLSGYEGAGTVEFLMDAERNFYFLEMNTRLQVEHPVTEMITGLDLVELQIRIARGEKLPLTQEQLTINGHAIELRICAEDPQNDFLPSIGQLSTYKPPVGADIRIDDGYREGMEVPIYYDPLLAKLIVHAETRTDAIEAMAEAIDDYKVDGVATTLSFGRFVMQSEEFRSGMFDTHFIKDHFQHHRLEQDQSILHTAALAAAWLQQKHNSRLITVTNTQTKWRNRRTAENE